MAGRPFWHNAKHCSHAAGVGAGEPGAAAATRPVESASAAAAADGSGSDLMGDAVEVQEELAEFAACGAASDRGGLAPAGVQTLLTVSQATVSKS